MEISRMQSWIRWDISSDFLYPTENPSSGGNTCLSTSPWSAARDSLGKGSYGLSVVCGNNTLTALVVRGAQLSTPIQSHGLSVADRGQRP